MHFSRFHCVHAQFFSSFFGKNFELMPPYIERDELEMRNERVVVYVRTRNDDEVFFPPQQSSHEARRLVRECWYRAYIFAFIQFCTMSERENETLERERKRAKRIAFIHIEISLVKLLYKTLSISFCALTPTHTAYAHRTDTLHTREAPHKYFGWILWLCYFFSSFFHTPQPTRPCAVCATGRGEERKREMLEEKKLGRRRQKNSVRESTEHRRQADFSMSIRVS